MRSFNRTVLVGDTGVIARRPHAIMGTQHLATPGEVLRRITLEIAECSRKAIATVFKRSTTECPQRVLQPFGQHHKAVAPSKSLVNGVLEPNRTVEARARGIPGRRGLH